MARILSWRPEVSGRMTSAPISANSCPAMGPAQFQPKSSTLTPARALERRSPFVIWIGAGGTSRIEAPRLSSAGPAASIATGVFSNW